MDDNPKKTSALPWYRSFAVWSWLFPGSIGLFIYMSYFVGQLRSRDREVEIFMGLVPSGFIAFLLSRLMRELRERVFVVRCLGCGWEFRVKTLQSCHGHCPACNGDIFSYYKWIKSKVLPTTLGEQLSGITRIQSSYLHYHDITGAELLQRLEEYGKP